MLNEPQYKVKKTPIGIYALVLAFIALAVAFFPKGVEIVYPPPPPAKIDVGETIKNKALSLFNKQDTKKKKEVKKPKIDYNKIKRVSLNLSIATALLAFSLSIISYVKNENNRLYRSSFTVCIVAILSNFYWLAIILIFIALVFFIIWAEFTE
jgi:disulfide bond formation protein DsbB